MINDHAFKNTLANNQCPDSRSLCNRFLGLTRCLCGWGSGLPVCPCLQKRTYALNYVVNGLLLVVLCLTVRKKTLILSPDNYQLNTHYYDVWNWMY